MQAPCRSSCLQKLGQKNIIWSKEIYFIHIQYTATGYMHNIHRHTIIIKFITFQYVLLSSRILISHVCPENLEFTFLYAI